MKNKSLTIASLFCLSTLVACAQENTELKCDEAKTSTGEVKTVQVVDHNFGGWYCPDNLRGFPPVDLANWESVPAINGRMATQKETQTEASLIFIDPTEYPSAKPLDLKVPQLATYESPYTHRTEAIIIIQALNIQDDSIVGFRYLNGGNGSARLKEVNLISEKALSELDKKQFIHKTVVINAQPEKVRAVMTQRDYTPSFQLFSDEKGQLKSDWRGKTNVNFNYDKAGELTSDYADLLFGNFYVQNDYDRSSYTEKFLVYKNENTQLSHLQIALGPFGEDYEKQKSFINQWAAKVKELSEK